MFLTYHSVQPYYYTSDLFCAVYASTFSLTLFGCNKKTCLIHSHEASHRRATQDLGEETQCNVTAQGRTLHLKARFQRHKLVSVASCGLVVAAAGFF